MAGPWFTVRESGGAWQTVETIRLSDGARDERVRVELRVELEAADDAAKTRSGTQR